MVVQDFRRVVGKGCLTTVMASLINFSTGLAVTENQLFVAAGGIIIRIHRFPREGSYEYNVKSLTFNVDWVAEAFGVSLERKTVATADEAWDETSRVLTSGRPQAAWIDIFHMPYSKNYRTNHARHLVVIIGLDRAVGRVAVSDLEFEGDVALDAISVARSKLDLAYEGIAISGVEGDIPAVRAEHLLAWLDRNLAFYVRSQAESTEDMWIGPQGLDLLREDLTGPIAEAGVMGRYTYDMLFHSVASPGGMIYSRQCMAGALEDLATLDCERSEVWARAAEVYASLVRKWRMLAALLLKGTMEDPPAVRERLVGCLDQIREHEQAGLDIMHQGLKMVGKGQWI